MVQIFFFSTLPHYFIFVCARNWCLIYWKMCGLGNRPCWWSLYCQHNVMSTHISLRVSTQNKIFLQEIRLVIKKQLIDKRAAVIGRNSHFLVSIIFSVLPLMEPENQVSVSRKNVPLVLSVRKCRRALNLVKSRAQN